MTSSSANSLISEFVRDVLLLREYSLSKASSSEIISLINDVTEIVFNFIEQFVDLSDKAKEAFKWTRVAFYGANQLTAIVALTPTLINALKGDCASISLSPGEVGFEYRNKKEFNIITKTANLLKNKDAKLQGLHYG